jgi:hypothetical protein
MSQDITEAEFPKAGEPNYSLLCEGEFDPSLKKTIRTLIGAGPDYIVYLDQDLFVEWALHTSRRSVLPPEFGAILNEVSHLETVSIPLLGTHHMEPFRRLLGEAVARLIADSDSPSSRVILEKAAEYLRSRSLEQARMWYLTGSGVVTAVAMGLLIVLWSMSARVLASLGPDGLDVLLATCFGAIGAFVSILQRSPQITMDPAAGASVHYVESGARVLTGMLGALMLALAVKANIILGATKSIDHSLALLLLLAVAAGASERIVPSLIREVEGMVPKASS